MTDEELDHAPMMWGKKHRDRSPNTVAEIDPDYVVWMYENVKPVPCSKLLYDACVSDVLENQRSVRVSKDQDE